MTDKSKSFANPAIKTTKPKRPSTVSVPSTSRKIAPTTKTNSRTKLTKTAHNVTHFGEGDMNVAELGSLGTTGDSDEQQNRQIAYGRFLRAMLEDCLLDEKIEREETEIDIQMIHLADRFQKTMDQLDKTNRRLKDISFVVEESRLLDLKSKDCTRFYEMTDKCKPEEILKDLSAAEEACLDKLHTKNVDFGFNKESGHKQLLDAVNEAIEGLEDIKKHSKLDMDKFKEFEKSQHKLTEIKNDGFDLETLKSEFDTKFPLLSEKLIREASEKIVNMIHDDDDLDSDDD